MWKITRYLLAITKLTDGIQLQCHVWIEAPWV